MKSLMILIVLCSFSLHAYAVGDDSRGAVSAPLDWDEDSENADTGQHSPRYERMERDLDKEYDEGALTKTEYIQRQREIGDLGEK